VAEKLTRELFVSEVRENLAHLLILYRATCGTKLSFVEVGIKLDAKTTVIDQYSGLINLSDMTHIGKKIGTLVSDGSCLKAHGGKYKEVTDRKNNIEFWYLISRVFFAVL